MCWSGSRLLSTTLSKCEEDDAITQAYLHVHVDNEEAIAFYRRRGFVVAETLRGYYPRLDPPDAVVLTRPLAPCTTIGSG
jgi:ribosomal protein S18 acetylase RimI-like enzyme